MSLFDLSKVSTEWKQHQARADFYFGKGLAQSTLRSYQSGIKRYREFCIKLNKLPFPESEDVLSAFVAMLAEEGLSYSSIRLYLSAIRYHHIKSDLGEPGISAMPRLAYIVKGVKREGVYTQSTKPQRERQPITPDTLKKMFTIWNGRSDLVDAKMLWAAACTAFFGFLRIGEFTSPTVSTFDSSVHLAVSDISVDHPRDPTALFIRLKQSKTDQLRKGVTVVLGKTDQAPLCPVSAMISYLVVRGMTPGPAFKWSDGHYLTRANFVTEVKRALELTGRDSSCFNGHSFRIGAASTAAARGMEDSLIKTLGRWESDAYQRYIKLSRRDLAQYSKTIAS